MLSIPAIATIIAVFMWVIMNVLIKRVATKIGVAASAIVMGLGIIPMVVAVIIVGNYSIPYIYLIFAIIAGLLGGYGMTMTFTSLKTEQLTKTTVLSEVQPVIYVLFGVLILGEGLTTIQTISIIIIFIGTGLVISTENLKLNKRLIPALLSGLSWSGYWLLMTSSIIGSNTFALPIAISRIVATIVMMAYLVTNKDELRQLSVAKKTSTSKGFSAFYVLALLAIIAGLVDGVGDTIFAFVVGSNSLAVGGALTALQPILVSFFAFIIYKERLNPMQLAGFVLMCFGAIILSIL